MPVVRHRVRVRVVTNPEKYQRHRRNKLVRRLRRVAWWGGLLTVAVAVMWLLFVAICRLPPFAEPETGFNALGY